MILITSILIVTHLAEAHQEAKHGDKYHWDSLLAQCLVTTGIRLGLICSGSDLPFLHAVGAFIMVRTWFDWMYNYFKGYHMGYLGTVANTDNLLRKIPFIIITLGRIAITVTIIYLTI